MWAAQNQSGGIGYVVAATQPQMNEGSGIREKVKKRKNEFQHELVKETDKCQKYTYTFLVANFKFPYTCGALAEPHNSMQLNETFLCP